MNNSSTAAVRPAARPLADADLPVLSRYVLGQVRLSAREHRQRDDLLSTATLAGLAAIRSAEAKQVRPARRIVLLAMQGAVYRELKRTQPAQLPEDWDHADHRRPDEAPAIRDEVAAAMTMIQPEGRRLLQQWVGGKSLNDLADAEGVSRATVWLRIDVALQGVRRSALEGERRSNGQPDARAGKRNPNAILRDKTGCVGLTDGQFDSLLPAGGLGWGGKDRLTRGAVNGWASEFIKRPRLAANSVVSEEPMPEHTHLLLEQLIASVRENTAELKSIRSALLAAAAGPPPGAPSATLDAPHGGEMVETAVVNGRRAKARAAR